MTVSIMKVYSLSSLLSTPSALPVSQPPPVRPHHHTLAVCPAWLNCLPSIMDTAECKYAANLVADGDLSRPCPAVCTGPSEQPAGSVSVSSSGCRTCFCPWRQTSRLFLPLPTFTLPVPPGESGSTCRCARRGIHKCTKQWRYKK